MFQVLGCWRYRISFAMEGLGGNQPQKFPLPQRKVQPSDTTGNKPPIHSTATQLATSDAPTRPQTPMLEPRDSTALGPESQASVLAKEQDKARTIQIGQKISSGGLPSPDEIAHFTRLTQVLDDSVAAVKAVKSGASNWSGAVTPTGERGGLMNLRPEGGQLPPQTESPARTAIGAHQVAPSSPAPVTPVRPVGPTPVAPVLQDHSEPFLKPGFINFTPRQAAAISRMQDLFADLKGPLKTEPERHDFRVQVEKEVSAFVAAGNNHLISLGSPLNSERQQDLEVVKESKAKPSLFDKAKEIVGITKEETGDPLKNLELKYKLELEEVKSRPNAPADRHVLLEQAITLSQEKGNLKDLEAVGKELKSSLLQQHALKVNPELARVLTNPQYDMEHDATVAPEAVEKYLLNLDKAGKTMLPEVRDKLLDHMGYEANDLKYASASILEGEREKSKPEHLKNLFMQQPELKMNLQFVLKPEFVPETLRGKNREPSAEELGQMLATVKGQTIFDKMEKFGKAGSGAGPGNDGRVSEQAQASGEGKIQPYTNLQEGVERMGRKAILFSQALSFTDPVKRNQYLDEEARLLQQGPPDKHQARDLFDLQAVREKFAQIETILPDKIKANAEELAAEQKKMAPVAAKLGEVEAGLRSVETQISHLPKLIVPLSKDANLEKELKAQRKDLQQQITGLKQMAAPMEQKIAELENSKRLWERDFGRAEFDIKSWKAIGALNPTERMALVAYTSELYTMASNPLRQDMTRVNSAEQGEILDWLKVAKSALNKLPSYEGTSFRMEDDHAYTRIRKPGNVLSDPSFTSTAQDLQGTRGAGTHVGMLTINKVSNGKMLDDLSFFGGGIEKEVLLPPMTRTLVDVQLEKPPNKSWQDVLSEPGNQQLLKEYGVAMDDLFSGTIKLGTETRVINFQREL